jgi:type I restriction enzyme R subunit
MTTPEARARQNIDSQLTACGWVVQDRASMNLYAGRGVAVREFPLETGYADYLLFVDRKAAGILEAKAEGIPLSAVALLDSIKANAIAATEKKPKQARLF